jgi:WD40 repeat protein
VVNSVWGESPILVPKRQIATLCAALLPMIAASCSSQILTTPASLSGLASLTPNVAASTSTPTAAQIAVVTGGHISPPDATVPPPIVQPLNQIAFTSAFAMAWSPAEDRLAVTTSRGLYLTTPLGALDQAALIPSEKPLEYVAFSPTGHEVAASENGENVFVWDLSTRNLKYTMDSFINFTFGVFYDRGGKLLVAEDQAPADRVDILVFDEGQDAGFFAIPDTDRFSPLAINPNGDSIVAWNTGWRRFEIWGTRLEPLRTFQALYAFDLAYSPDGTLLAAVHQDCMVRLWKTDTVKMLDSFRWCDSQQDAYARLAFSPDGKALAVATNTGEILVWDVSSSAPVGQIAIPKAQILSAAFSPDGSRLALLRKDGLLQIWDIAE